MLFFPKDSCPWFNSSEGLAQLWWPWLLGMFITITEVTGLWYQPWHCLCLKEFWRCFRQLQAAEYKGENASPVGMMKSSASILPWLPGLSAKPDLAEMSQTPREEGTAPAMRSFSHYSENSNTNKILPAVPLQQGELFVLQAEGFLWNSTFPIRSPRQHEVTITFSGHKWPKAQFTNSRTCQSPVKVRRKWMCSRSHCKFQSSAETEPRSLIHIHIPNQYFKKIKV